MYVISQDGNGKFKKARFELSDSNLISIGWTDGALNDGWDCPKFEKEESDKIMYDYNSYFDKEEEFAKYDEKTDTYIYPLYNGDVLESVDEYKGYTINILEGEKKVYPIGGNEWTWDKVEED